MSIVDTKKLGKQLSYWKECLRDLSPLELPTDYPRPPVQTYRGASHPIEFPEILTEALRGLSREEGVTLFMTLLAAFHGLLHRYTGQDDIAVGTPLAGRNRAEIEGVMRTDASGDPVFRELLKQVRKAALDAYPHQHFPFEKLVEELQPERDPGRNPLFQVMFALQNVPHSTLDLPGLELGRMEIADTRTMFDLDVCLWENEEGLKGEFVYNANLFDRATIERMAGHYQRILEGIVADPEQRLSEAPLLTEAERHQMLVEWNDTAVDYPRDKCIHKLFEEQAEKVPDTVAVVFKDRKITYRELNERANQLARGLRSEGVRSDVVVGIMVHRSIDMISGLLGVLKAGGAYLPIDPENPDSRIEYMLKDSDARVLLTQENFMHRLDYDGHRIALDRDSFIKEDVSNLDVTGSSRDLAYVIYTSGSTGIPKGVMVEHRSVVNLSTWFDGKYELAKNGNVIQSTTFSFDVAMEEIISTLINGACLFIPEKEETLDKHKFRAFIKKNRINIAQFVPVTLREFLADAEKIDCLNIVITAGEALDERLKEQILQKGYTLYNNYGPSETTVDVLSTKCGNERVTIGKPIFNTKCYILDKRFNPVPVGVAGELTIGGDGLARGYLNRPELTAEKFIPDPFSNEPGVRLYRTGDLARYLADGNIEFLGRIDNQVKVRGHRIELDEIETLLRHHPDVRETVVIVREDQPGIRRLVAYVVSDPGATPSTSELRCFLGEKLPDYMVPSVFVPLDRLPLTASCKVDRRALPAPDGSRPEIEEMYEAPRTAIEQSLAAIWIEVLGVDRVGIYDNFFELGGDSLSAVRVISRTQDATGVELSSVTLFEAPSVAGLAHLVAQAPVLRTGLKLPPVLPRSRNQVAPLSFGQQEIWLSHQLWPGIPVYNEPETIYLKRSLDPVILEKAFIRLIRRHEILRTFFITEGGVPVQAVREEPAMELRVVDLQSVDITEREDAALRYATEEVRRPFDLLKAPLFRASLVLLDDSDHRLYMVFHHMVTDGFSINQVLVPELWVHYEAVLKGIPSPLTELTVQYSDYATWQHEILHTPVMEQHLAYWKEQLNGLLPLDMPAARTRPPVQTFRGAFHRLSISKEVTDGLKALGRGQGCTLYMVLLAAFKTFLWRYTHQDDIAVGTIDAGRSRPELEPLLGYFLNTIVIRTDLSRNPTFREFLLQVRQIALEAYAHKDVPFITLVEALKPPRDAARHPLYQVAFVMEPNFPAQESGWVVSQYEVQPGTSKFDLTLELEEREEQMIGRLEYDTALFDSDAIERMAGHYQKILEGIVTNPDLRLSELPLLTDSERHQLLEEWNNTAVDYPKDKCIQELFEEQVERTPDAVAVIFEERQLTYMELNSRANQLAHYLRKHGVGPDILVGICIERSLEMVVGILGILKAGGAYVPLDPTYPKERLVFMLEDAAAPIILTQSRLSDRLPRHRGLSICLDTQWEEIARQSHHKPVNEATSTNLAYVIYTSGSTGKPKGAMNTHQGICNRILWMQDQYRLTSADAVLQKTPFSFDVSVWEFFWPLLTGVRLIMARPGGHQDPAYLVRIIMEHRITIIHFVPSMLRYFLEASGIENCTSLRHVMCSGEALAWDLQERFFSRMNSQLHNLYGPTEAAVDVTHWTCVRLSNDLRIVPIGRPVANTQTYILDSQLQPVPIGVTGQLYLGGVQVARGYLNRPELTAEKFIHDPFSDKPGARLYKTGDLARYLSDGNIEFLGRIDHQVKIRGFRIELGEIEAILGQHPEVLDTTVMAREDQPGDKRLAAYIRLHKESKITTGELRDFLKEQLPDYMIPSAFVVLDSLPLSPNGKIDRKALPRPEQELPDRENPFVGPRTPVEELLTNIWSEVLGIKEISVHDNFFELGGHSLLAIRVLSRIHKALEIEIPLRFLFETPTPAGLLEKYLMKKASSPVKETGITRRDTSEPCRLSFSQERLWLYNQIEPEVPNIIPYVLRMKGHLDRYTLEKSLDAIVTRHESLRTTFSSETGGPLQVIHPARPVQMAVIDLGTCPEADRQTEVQRLIDAEERPFDLIKDLMLRATLIRLSDTENILILTTHHIASDGWSTGIFFR